MRETGIQFRLTHDIRFGRKLASRFPATLPRGPTMFARIGVLAMLILDTNEFTHARTYPHREERQ